MADFDPFAYPEYIQRTARSIEIERLQRYYDSTQYDGRPDWWTGTRKDGQTDQKVPLRERKPCVIYELPKASVEQVVRFLFGDGRFPQLRVPEVEAEDSLSGNALTKDDAETVQKWLAEFVDRAKIKPIIRALAKRGIGMKTAVAVMSLQRGQFKVLTPRAQDCWAEFIDGDPSNDVTRLVWSYEYDRETQSEKDGSPVTKRYRFRREWDANEVRVFEPVEVKQGRELSWGEPEATAHGFGFCPVVWIPNMHEDSSGELDGVGLYDGLEDEFDALNFAYSQRHRGIHYWGTPQPWETGVEPGDGPHADGRGANPSPAGYSAGPPQHGSAAPKRKISPDEIWSYESGKVDIGLLETTGKAFEVATNHINDIRSRVLEQMGVVLTSMADTVSRTSATGDMSARFLQLAHAPLLGLVAELRHCWWPYGLQRVLNMALRIVTQLNGEGVLVPGSKEVAKALSGHFIVLDGAREWIPPKIDPVWGRYFEPSAQEVKTSVDAATAASNGKLITTATATRFIADDMAIDDPQAEIDELNAEADDDAEEEAESDVADSAVDMKDQTDPLSGAEKTQGSETS